MVRPQFSPLARFVSGDTFASTNSPTFYSLERYVQQLKKKKTTLLLDFKTEIKPEYKQLKTLQIMNFRLNILTILFLSLSLLTFVACDKTNGLEVKTAEFSVNHDSIYLTNSVVFTANDSLGGNEYSWDFGDGNTETGKYNVTHTYEKGGIYLASMTINGFKSSRTITVHKGTLSFRIVNKSSKYFDCLTWIDDYNGSVSRFWVDPKSQSDTKYGWSSTNKGNQHRFGISIFIENSEYTFPDIIWINDFQHHDFIVTDSTIVVPRSSHNNSNSVLIKDL